MKRRFRLTRRALDDLRNIGRYTQKTWGSAQRNDDLRELDNRFDWLAENPLRRRHRPEVMEGYYSFPHRSYVIFYVIDADTIAIIGVPHQAMDIVSYLRSGS